MLMSGDAEENGEEMNEGGKIMAEVTMSDIMGRAREGSRERSRLTTVQNYYSKA